MRYSLLLLGLLLPLPLSAQEIRATATLTGYRHYNVAALVFSADSKTLAIGTPQGVQLWDVTKGQERALLKPHSPQESWRALAFSPDGKRLAGSGQNAIVLWDMETNAYQTQFPSTGALAWTGDGKFIVDFGIQGCARTHLRIWDVEKRRMHLEYESNQYVGASVALAANGKDLILGTSGGFVFMEEPLLSERHWNRDTRSLWLPRPHWWMDSMTSAVSPRCQRYASSDKEGTLTLGGIATSQTQKFVKAHESEAFALAFSANGLTLASGGADKSIKLWDAITGDPLATLTGHTDRVSGLAFSPDGKTLASGSYDRTMKLWVVSGVVKK